MNYSERDVLQAWQRSRAQYQYCQANHDWHAGCCTQRLKWEHRDEARSARGPRIQRLYQF